MTFGTTLVHHSKYPQPHYKNHSVNTVWVNNHCLFSETFKTVCGQSAGFLMFQHCCCCCLLSLSSLLCLFLLFLHTSLHVLTITLKIVSFVRDITATFLALRLFILEVLSSNLSPETICSEVFVVFLSPFRQCQCNTQGECQTAFLCILSSSLNNVASFIQYCMS